MAFMSLFQFQQILSRHLSLAQTILALLNNAIMVIKMDAMDVLSKEDGNVRLQLAKGLYVLR